MAKPRKPLGADPVDAHNKQILADRDARLKAQRPQLPDLGLALKAADPEPTTAAEFMDQFDKAAFGYAEATMTKIVWGPDPLVDYSPAFRDMLDRHGKEDLAHLYEEAILTKGATAMPDPLMARSMSLAINKFGRESVAAAFRDRVLRIPFRTVEIDASDEPDPEVLGSQVLAETVRRHERPGMDYRFFTQLCVDRMGWRGYTPVKEGGEIVRAGTLMLAEIPRAKAEARRLRTRQQSQSALDGIADSYAATAEAAIEAASRDGVKTHGLSSLGADEIVNVNYGDEDQIGRTRSAGVELGREDL